MMKMEYLAVEHRQEVLDFFSYSMSCLGKQILYFPLYVTYARKKWNFMVAEHYSTESLCTCLKNFENKTLVNDMSSIIYWVTMASHILVTYVLETEQNFLHMIMSKIYPIQHIKIHFAHLILHIKIIN